MFRNTQNGSLWLWVFIPVAIVAAILSVTYRPIDVFQICLFVTMVWSGFVSAAYAKTELTELDWIVPFAIAWGALFSYELCRYMRYHRNFSPTRFSPTRLSTTRLSATPL